MATHIIRTVVDDLDNSTDGVGTYRFALDGVEYEIDLSQPNLERLRTALAVFITAGRRLPKNAATTRTATKQTPTGKVRAWWADNETRVQTENGEQLPAWRANGPIPPAVYAAFRASHHEGS
jgi:hypothetical protein